MSASRKQVFVKLQKLTEEFGETHADDDVESVACVPCLTSTAPTPDSMLVAEQESATAAPETL